MLDETPSDVQRQRWAERGSQVPNPKDRRADQALPTGYAARRNWSLWIGSLIVMWVIAVAVAGPAIAPKDPLEETLLVRIGDEWSMPSPDPFTAPGFPLGADSAGRDVLSRLLWAVRPTMTMVISIAAIRMALGILIGLGAGWFTGSLARGLDTAISAALSVPVLIVALAAIAAVGVEVGVLAFIVGLSINGWAETASQVRAQTVVTKGHLYVEAARALGASNPHILFSHVLRQIMPMVWMLFAFEVSATLMVTAALGFLGYYIGGDVWVRTSDRGATAISGMPELGQMLATTPLSVLHPWVMIILGSVIFVTVLGFNLLGRGLRQRLSLEQRPKESVVSRVAERVRSRTWSAIHAVELGISEQIWKPLVSNRLAFSAILVAGSVLVAAGLIWPRLRAQVKGKATPQKTVVSSGPLWASERHDAQGTLWTQASAPVTPEIQWTFRDPNGFSGGPVVSKDGTVYVTSNAGTVYALDALGDVLWQTSLPAGLVETLSLGAAGELYVTDEKGRLYALTVNGTVRWRFESDDGPSTSGPVVASDGSIYYVLRGGVVQAVSPEGQALWKQRVLQNPVYPAYSAPRLDPDGQWLFLEDAVVSARDGSSRPFDSPVPVDQYLVGADGGMHFVSGHTVTQWQATPSGIELLRNVEWRDYRKFTAGRVRASDAGVTADGLIWLLYTGRYSQLFGFFDDTRIVWLDAGGQMRGSVIYPQPESRVIAVAPGGLTYVCGTSRGGSRGIVSSACLALEPASDQPLWRVSLEDGVQVRGGALVPGRLYVSLQEGVLYAIGAGQSAELAAEPPETAEAPAEILGPTSANVAWVFEDDSGFSSGPVVSDDGTVYISSSGRILYALQPTGTALWQARLTAAPVGSPALGAAGEIFVSDRAGSLSAFASDGSLLWRFEPPESRPATVGPLVASDGTVYYAAGNTVQAVSSTGQRLWQARTRTFRTHTPLQLSPSEEWLFFAEDILQTANGSLLELDAPVKVDAYIAGNDGHTYVRADDTVYQWRLNDSRVEIVQTAAWSSHSAGLGGGPTDAGVTREQVIWLLYTTKYGESTRIVWLDSTGRVLGSAENPFSQGRMMGLRDSDGAAFVCGLRHAQTDPVAECVAFAPQWQQPFLEWAPETREGFAGGALAPGRLYVATREGSLYAIGRTE